MNKFGAATVLALNLYSGCKEFETPAPPEAPAQSIAALKEKVLKEVKNCLLTVDQAVCLSDKGSKTNSCADSTGRLTIDGLQNSLELRDLEVEGLETVLQACLPKADLTQKTRRLVECIPTNGPFYFESLLGKKGVIEIKFTTWLPQRF